MRGASHFTHSALLNVLKQLQAQRSSLPRAMEELRGLQSPSKASRRLASLFGSRFYDAAGSDNRPLEPEMIPQAEKNQLTLLQHLCLLQSRIPSLQNPCICQEPRRLLPFIDRTTLETVALHQGCLVLLN
jgi:hypothetical protein